MKESSVFGGDSRLPPLAIIDIDDRWIHDPQVVQSVFHCGNSNCRCDLTVFYTRLPTKDQPTH